MNAHAFISAPSDDPATDDRAQALVQDRLAMLTRLGDAGLAIALALERQVTGEAETPVTQGDPALAYARVSRAVRMTVALQIKLIQDLPALQAGEATARVQAARRRTADRAGRLECILDEVVISQTDDEDAAEQLCAEAAERLEDEILHDGDVMDRPFSEVVADICADLGLEPDWAEVAQQSWARQAIRHGRPGAPLAAVAAQSPPDDGAADPHILPPFTPAPDVRDVRSGAMVRS
jgi:hypothetical protein